jgi:guanine deaminase
MCWGAIQWSRVKKVYTGVDRFTAAKFGFDDKVFYDELAAQSGHHAVRLGRTMPNIDPAMLEISMMGETQGAQVQAMLEDMKVNLTYRRRAGCETVGFRDDGKRFSNKQEGGIQHISVSDPEQVKYMSILEGAVRKAVKMGLNKEREIFASCIVKDGKLISLAVNEVLKRRDATATSEVLAIRKAADRRQTYVLSGCTMYTTMEPDVMSLGAILWARIDKLYFGLSQKQAAIYGFEEGLLQYRELFADPDLVHNVIDVEEKVGFEACENVFKSWLQCNAIVY